MKSDLHRTNINLWQGDVEFLQRRLGYGWTEKIREIVHEWVKEKQSYDPRIEIVKKLTSECLRDNYEPESFVGQYMWPDGTINSNVAHRPEAVKITANIAKAAKLLMEINCE